MNERAKKKLIAEALEARKNSYCPYSGFAVGAALLCKDGTIFRGCNIENASYGLTNCAERSAIFSAVSAGFRDFTAIAVVGAPKEEKAESICPPCGSCRQVMAEFGNPEKFTVLLGTESGSYKEYLLKELLPLSFEL